VAAQGSSLKSTGPKKNKTVKRGSGTKKESTLGKGAGRSRPGSGGTIAVSGDMDDHRPSPSSSREQAHRDIAFVFGEKDGDGLERAGSEVPHSPALKNPHSDQVSLRRVCLLSYTCQAEIHHDCEPCYRVCASRVECESVLGQQATASICFHLLSVMYSLLKCT
jgi:hypothetical protein